jgi:hypothetical protein
MSKSHIRVQRVDCDFELKSLRKSMSGRRKHSFVCCASSVMTRISVGLSGSRMVFTQLWRISFSLSEIHLMCSFWRTS